MRRDLGHCKHEPGGPGGATDVAINLRAFEDRFRCWCSMRALPGGRRGQAYIPCMENQRPLETLSDDELLLGLAELMRQSRRVESDLVAHIAEVDERRLYAREASPSMFAYCTDVLHLSEAEAYLRIAAARASREHPMLLTMLGDGRLHLTGIAKLAPHLTRENRDALLKRATHRSKRQIEELIAEIAPRPDVPAVMTEAPREERGQSATPSVVRIQCRQRCRNSVRTELPSWPWLRLGASRRRPAPGSRSVQGAVHRQRRAPRQAGATPGPDAFGGARRRSGRDHRAGRHREARTARSQALRQDEGSPEEAPRRPTTPPRPRATSRPRSGVPCVSATETDAATWTSRARRCSERDRLEFHHRHPFGLGGDHSPQNIRLMCRAHNAYLAEHDYGREAMARYRRLRHGVPEEVATDLGAGRRVGLKYGVGPSS